VSEGFDLLERIVQHKVIGIIIYVHNVDESNLTIFWGKNRKSDNGEMPQRIFVQSEGRRGQPLRQQLSAVSAAGCCAPAVVNTERPEHVQS